jgi:pantetheine-phosphate adenylyltransferase
VRDVRAPAGAGGPARAEGLTLSSSSSPKVSNVSKVLYPGSFDPFHNGHLEIVETAAQLFDEVLVAVTHNPQKAAGMFPLHDRLAMVGDSVAHLPNVSVTQFSGLVVDLANERAVTCIVKGLRVASDFEVELQMAQMNHAVGGVRTVFLPSASAHTFLASKFIREVARYGGDVSAMVPPPVAKRLSERHAS